MNAIAVDTLAIAKRLVSSGYSQQQAEAQAQLWAEFVDEKLATKADLAATRDDLERSLERAIKELDYRLTIKLGGMLVVAISIMTTLIKLG